MRDKFSGEVSSTLTQYGVYRKFKDRGYKVKGDPTSGFDQADVEPGFPDGVFVGKHRGAYIETKTGSGTFRERFDFANWRPNQRQMYRETFQPMAVPYWIFLVMGREIGSKTHPRIALLMDAETLLALEAKCSPRKSLSLEMAQKLLMLNLIWAGSERWLIPRHHPFYVEFRLGE